MNDKVKEGFNKVRSDIKSVVKKNTQAFTDFNERLKKIEASNDSFSDMSKNLLAIDQKLKSIEGTFDSTSINKELSDVKKLAIDKNTLDKEYASAKKTEQRLNSLDSNVAEVLDAIKDLKKEVKSELKTVLDTKEEINSQISELKSSIDTSKDDLVTKESVKEITTQLMDEFERKFSEVKKELEDQKANAKELTRSKDQLVQELDDKVNALVAEKLDGVVKSSDLDEKFDLITQAVKVDVQNFKQELGCISSSVNTVNDEFSKFKGELDRTKAELEMMSLMGTNVNSMLEELKSEDEREGKYSEQLSELSSQLSSMQLEQNVLKDSLDDHFESHKNNLMIEITKLKDEFDTKLKTQNIGQEKFDAINKEFDRIQNFVKSLELDTKNDLLGVTNTLGAFVTKDHLNSELELLKKSVADAFDNSLDSKLNETSFYKPVDNASTNTVQSKPQATSQNTSNESKNKTVWEKVVDFFVEEEEPIKTKNN